MEEEETFVSENVINESSPTPPRKRSIKSTIKSSTVVIDDDQKQTEYVYFKEANKKIDNLKA